MMETFLTVINRKQYYKTNSDSASDIFMSSQDSKLISFLETLIMRKHTLLPQANK